MMGVTLSVIVTQSFGAYKELCGSCYWAQKMHIIYVSVYSLVHIYEGERLLGRAMSGAETPRLISSFSRGNRKRAQVITFQ